MWRSEGFWLVVLMIAIVAIAVLVGWSQIVELLNNLQELVEIGEGR